ncbi:MAG: serine/threonine protein kinase [Deltaproteobacteria bacterium]|nr:serine/threonine protein kinase [Deltaproteobacteria bacterium]MBW2529856.1 serine/threonine protein kinase [Deltaproteobacteria bacterium]
MTSEAHQQQRYRVLERLAAGGMAEVYLAESAGIEGFQKRVAIKRVLPHLSEKKRFIAMFLDEARLSANFSHSNIVQVFDIGVGDQTYFIVMEYVDGPDLKAVINHLRSNNRPFPVESAILICSKICEGLGYAHEMTDAEGTPLKAVHRDISPPNVLLSKHGEVKIVDFGLAKASTQLEKSEAGIIKGKFHYLAPEAAHGREVDQRADIFAVGIILWEMLAGRRLFTGKSDYQVVKAVQRCEVPPISKINRDATPELESILSRALARNADQRYQSARALALDLTRCLFRYGRPVDAFSIGELVRAPMLTRERTADDGQSIIDKLIQETLFEFTSLKTDEEPGHHDLSQPIAISGFDFEDFGRLADKTDGPSRDGQAAQLVRSTLAMGALEEGNLAALEEPDEPLGNLADRLTPDPAGARASDSGGHDVGRVSVQPSSADASGRRSRTSLASVPSAKKPSGGGSGLVKALLLVLVAAGTAAALWFSGLL